MSDSVRPHRPQPTRLPRPWDSPGKNTGVGCHFLFQCMKMKSESEITQSCPTLSNPMDCSPPGSSVHGIFQARVLVWVAVAFSFLWAGWWLLSRPRLFNYTWESAPVPLNQGPLTGDKSKSRNGRCFVSAPWTACIAVGVIYAIGNAFDAYPFPSWL